MRRVILILCALTLFPISTRAQDTQAIASQAKAERERAEREKAEPPQRPIIVTRSNVRVELTISDQRGTGPAEKKQVSMIVSEMAWGKIRTHADAKSPTGPPMQVALNVDARPYITKGGDIQLELVVNYNPLDETNKVGLVRPTELNQSMTVVLQSGKPLVVAQAADPLVDRKMIVEVVATILK